MELCYMVSMSTLHEILQQEAKPNTAYRLVASGDTVTVIHYGPEGLIDQLAFPIIYRVEDVPEDEGTLMLMVARNAAANGRASGCLWKQNCRTAAR